MPGHRHVSRCAMRRRAAPRGEGRQENSTTAPSDRRQGAGLGVGTESPGSAQAARRHHPCIMQNLHSSARARGAARVARGAASDAGGARRSGTWRERLPVRRGGAAGYATRRGRGALTADSPRVRRTLHVQRAAGQTDSMARYDPRRLPIGSGRPKLSQPGSVVQPAPSGRGRLRGGRRLQGEGMGRGHAARRTSSAAGGLTWIKRA